MFSIKKLDNQSLQDQVVDNIEAVEGRSLWQDAWARFRKNRAAMTSVYVLTFITLCITFGPSIAAFGHDEIDWDVLADPYELGKPSLSSGHYFGTDDLGQDLFCPHHARRSPFDFSWLCRRVSRRRYRNDLGQHFRLPRRRCR